MDDALRDGSDVTTDESAAVNRIGALEAALAAIDPLSDDRHALRRRDRLYSDLFALRGRRISRMNEENWQRLERLVGHKLAR